MCMRAWALILVLLAFAVAPRASQAANYVTAAAASAACTAYWQSTQSQYPTGGWPGDSGCVLWNGADPANKTGAYGIGGHCCGAGHIFQWDTSYVPPNQCSTATPVSGAFSGQLAKGAPMCGGQPDGSGCAMAFTPDGPSFLNRSGTTWATHGTYSPSGSQCTPGAVGPGNAPPPPAAPTKSCGSGSCFDSANNKYCAVSGGTQVCVPGSTASSGGGCASVGESTLCAGSPAPVPAPPPVSPISNPSQEIKSSDNYTTSGPSGNQTITTNVYSAGNSATSSGQGSGDDGPASSSSTAKGDGTTSSGGYDCNTPPIVQGSGGMSAIAYQTWRTRCDLEGQKSSGGSGASVGKLYTPSTDTAQSVVANFQAQVQQAPIASVATSFFSVGGTGGSCPTWTWAASDWNPEETFDFYCRPELGDLLDMARIVLLIVCAYTAFRIALGDS